MKKYLYKCERISKFGDYLDVDQILIFSLNNQFAEDNELKDVKFYLNNDNIINNLQDGKFIGYLISGEIENFKDDLNFKRGNINNLSNDLLRAIKYLANHLNANITDLPIQLYIVGQAALQYWDNKSRSTQDLDVIKSMPNEDLFNQKQFLDLIKETDRYIKGLEENSDEHDLIINNDAAYTGNFVFEMNYTKEVIIENVLELYFADEEGAKMNKVYAYFVQLLEEGRERTKDRNFVLNFIYSHGIENKEDLFNKWPQYKNIQTIANDWNIIFE